MLKAKSWKGFGLGRQQPESDFSCGVVVTDGQQNIILNLKRKQRWRPWPLQLSWSQAHRSSPDAAGIFTDADFYVHEIVNIDAMQLSFVYDRNTTDAICAAQQLQEKYFAANKLLYVFFVKPGQSSVRVNGQYSKDLSMGVGAH